MQDIDKIKNVIQSILCQEQVELVDLTYRWESGRNVLRLLIYKEGGVSLNDCTNINKILSDFFDKTDVIAQSFVLEVSSPGLDRPLITKRDFERNIGKDIKFILKNDKGATDTLIGTLKSMEAEKLILDVKGSEQEVLFERIIKAKLEIRI